MCIALLFLAQQKFHHQDKVIQKKKKKIQTIQAMQV
jgi:hypothetical protein